MARTSKLKVFRTPIGFHDAYVAAPSQKAALEAWGSDHNLFARGEAELVTDPALAEEPLAQPGVVIKRLRGSMDEQFAALGPAKHVKSGAPKPQPSVARRSRPSRATLEKAEAAIASTEQRHEEERRVLAEEERKLAARRRTLEQAQRRELADLQAALNAAQRAYDDALEDWRATI